MPDFKQFKKIMTQAISAAALSAALSSGAAALEPVSPQPSQPLQSSLVQGVTPLLFSKSLISDPSFSIRFTLRCVVSLYQMHMKKASPIMKNLYKPGEVGYNEG